MERLPGLLGDEPVYWIDSVVSLADGALETELGFSDVAAHPYEDLVAATVDVLRAVPGVTEVEHLDREVIAVRSRGVAPVQLADVVDSFWFERLPVTAVDPLFGLDPAEVLASPWPAAPPPPVGPMPAPIPAPPSLGRELRAAFTLPPSRRRMWTYLVLGAVPVAGGLALALTPGGGNGVIPIAVGAFNLVVGTRIALRRRAAAASPA
jgi:hypothetical protein